MKNHYWARMHVCKAKMKMLQGRLAKAQKRKKTPDPLQILAKASLTEHGTWLGTPSPNFKKFGENFVICEFFVQFTGFGFSKGLTPGKTFCHRSSVWQKLRIFGFGMKIYTCSSINKKFHRVLGLQKVKMHAKFDFLPLFWVAETSFGRIKFWQGKWPPNLKILVGLESRLADLSNELSCTQFW